jgi:nickel transport protein
MASRKFIRTIPSAVLLALILAILPSVPASAAETAGQAAEVPGAETMATPEPADDCRAVMVRMTELDSKLTRELGMLKRDIAALSQSVEEPGLDEAMAGLGYILGLFGIASFMASRRQRRDPEK